MLRTISVSLGIALLCTSALAEMRITFIDAGPADAAVVQIEQATGEPYTILVDGGDGDSDRSATMPRPCN